MGTCPVGAVNPLRPAVSLNADTIAASETKCLCPSMACQKYKFPEADQVQPVKAPARGTRPAKVFELLKCLMRSSHYCDDVRRHFTKPDTIYLIFVERCVLKIARPLAQAHI